MAQTLQRATLREALATLGRILDVTGDDQVRGLSIVGDVIAIQPLRLEHGSRIAQTLGLESALDMTGLVPPLTEWSGTIDGREVHVRGTLRRREDVVR